MTSRPMMVRERSRSAIMMPGRKIEAGKAKETTLKNYYEDTRYLIGINIESSQSDYQASEAGDKGMRRKIEKSGPGAVPGCGLHFQFQQTNGHQKDY